MENELRSFTNKIVNIPVRIFQLFSTQPVITCLKVNNRNTSVWQMPAG